MKFALKKMLELLRMTTVLKPTDPNPDLTLTHQKITADNQTDKNNLQPCPQATN